MEQNRVETPALTPMYISAAFFKVIMQLFQKLKFC